MTRQHALTFVDNNLPRVILQFAKPVCIVARKQPTPHVFASLRDLDTASYTPASDHPIKASISIGLVCAVGAIALAGCPQTKEGPLRVIRSLGESLFIWPRSATYAADMASAKKVVRRGIPPTIGYLRPHV
jgi:hypothetical protein